jgi:porin
MKIGKQDANADFCFPDLGAEFVHSSFQVPAAMPLPTWPNQALGVSMFYKPSEKWEILGGAMDGSADGRTWGFSTFSNNGMFLIGQVNYKYQAGEKSRHPGTWRFGTWYHTGKFTDQVTQVDQVQGNSGAYIVADQMLIPEDSPEQGLGIFTMLSWAPSDRNIVDQNLSVGLVYKGLLEGRDNDIIGLGLTTIEFNRYQRNLNGLSQETAIELYYRYQLTPWAAVQPDVQYIANPSGSGAQVQDALLFGLRFQLIL